MRWKVYINRRRDSEEIIENIIQEIRNIAPDIWKKVMETVVQNAFVPEQ